MLAILSRCGGVGGRLMSRALWRGGAEAASSAAIRRASQVDGAAARALCPWAGDLRTVGAMEWVMHSRRSYSSVHSEGPQEVMGMVRLGDGTIIEPKSYDEFLELTGLKPKEVQEGGDPAWQHFVALQQAVSDVPGLPPQAELLQIDEEEQDRLLRRTEELKQQEQIKLTRVRKVDELGRAYATGKRKESIARVWLKEGAGQIFINGRPYDAYFPMLAHRFQVVMPMRVTSTLGRFDVSATVKGGGTTGQAGAVRHGISKALQLFDPNYRPALKKEGLLTRDSRVVERKKPGKPKARKSFQWVKR